MICLHNLPDGLTIGAAYASTDFVSALALVTDTAIRDVPEGLVVALALRSVGYDRIAQPGSALRVRRSLQPVRASHGGAGCGHHQPVREFSFLGTRQPQQARCCMSSATIVRCPAAKAMKPFLPAASSLAL